MGIEPGPELRTCDSRSSTLPTIQCSSLLSKKSSTYIFINCTCSWVIVGNRSREGDVFPSRFQTHLFWQLCLGPTLMFITSDYTWGMWCICCCGHLDGGRTLEKPLVFDPWTAERMASWRSWKGVMGRGRQPLQLHMVRTGLTTTQLLIVTPLSCSDWPSLSHSLPSSYKRTDLRAVASPEGIEEDG